MTIDGAEGVEEGELSGREAAGRDFRWFQCGVLVVGSVAFCLAEGG